FSGQPLVYEVEGSAIYIRPAGSAVAKRHIPNVATNEVLQNSYTGLIVDENGNVIPGATVQVKGKSTVTLSDENGRFSLSAMPGDVLIITTVGYTGKEAVLGEHTDLGMLSMQSSFSDLEEVVVVGYGTQKKVNLTGAVDVVSGEELANRPSP